MQLPSALIFINRDINPPIQTKLETQLFSTETITYDEFVDRMTVTPNYVDIIHLNNLRVIVLLDNFTDTTYRNLADVVLFVKAGLAAILKNNYGSHELTLQVDRLYLHKLLRYNGLLSP
jgi:hypothetical protein